MNVKDATHATVHDYPGGAESLAPRMGIKSPQVLRNKVNPTTDTHHLRLDEAIRTDNKAQAHIIDAQDEHHHNKADAHVFMLNGLLVAKDVVMPLEQGGN